jgi:transcriptional regulator with GAF, ATPase, and Fis domain
LIESEFFGHVKGAFTGAVTARQGLFEQASGGTLFLDELAELPFDLQSKLLRVIQEREVQRVGGSEIVRVDVRIIAATNVDLESACAERRFREDLYYRLNVVPIHLPPLRDRRSDIPLLAEYFAEKHCCDEGLAPKYLSAEALGTLMEYSWPGNVRQLGHAIETAVVLSGSRCELRSEDFLIAPAQTKGVAPEIDVPDEGLCFDTFVSNVERGLIKKALGKTKGNRARAADLLGLKRTTLLAKLKTLEMDLPAVA